MFLNDLRKKYNEMELIKKTYMLVALICAALSVISLTINILLNFGIVQIGISFFVFMMAYLFYYMANSEKKFERLIFIIFIIVTVIMFDIDDFKIINDTYGHSIGDEVILGVSELLTLNTRENDIVGRIGGEEFLIVLSNANYGLALIIAEKLRLLISEKKWSKENLSVTVSGGVYTKEDTDTVEKTLEKVDVYLYKSKREGKNIIN